MGFQDHMIEQFETAERLKGYHGDWRKDLSHIRIKGSGWGFTQNYVGGASNDLGFEKMADGTYAFHVSEYDSHRYGKSWQDKFMKQYSKCVVEEVVKETSFCIMEETEEECGDLLIRLSSPF